MSANKRLRIRLTWLYPQTCAANAFEALVTGSWHDRAPGKHALVEARYGRDELQTVLTRERDGGSGIDWGSIVRVVTERYGGRLEHLRFLLSSNTSSADPLERAAVAREQLFPRPLTSSWATPVALRCVATQTSHITFRLARSRGSREHAP
ncbi:hypothetical protein EDB89DRAFT_2064899 [Lactarius sanguifluus]|nr:hypothetical protein EDB89DRAFT_2064899 [Lactarius sanguifluus]